MEEIQEFTFKGYLSKEAEDFFGEHLISEEREGCAVVGHFIKMADGTTYMPKKNDSFIKTYKGINHATNTLWGFILMNLKTTNKPT